MNRLKTPNHYGPAQMPNTSRFLTDEEYRLIQNNIVIGCTDVLIVDPSAGEALSSYRQQKPQEGFWFSCGGRMKRGQSYQEAGADKVKEELGINVDPSRLELLTAYSTAFNERAQEPQLEGVHTSNAVVTLFVTPEERERMRLSLNEEHAKTEWVPLENVLSNDDSYPPVLQDAVEKVKEEILSEYGHAVLDEVFSERKPSEDFTYESIGMPVEDFVVPKGQVFFEIHTSAPAYNNLPFTTTALSYLGGEEVNAQGEPKDRYNYERWEALLLGEGESKELTTYLLGVPVTSIIRNQEGLGQVIAAKDLPQSLVNEAMKLEDVFMDSRDIPTWHDVNKRWILQRKIKRALKNKKDELHREFQPAAHTSRTYFADGRLQSVGLDYPSKSTV